MEEKKKIILIAGGTGGHVFPALALSEFLKEKKANYCFLTDQRCKIILDKYKVDYKLISSSQIKKNIFSLPIMFLRILFGVTQSLIFFFKFKAKICHRFWWLYLFTTFTSCNNIEDPHIHT